MNAKVFKVCSKSFEILLCESLWMLLWTYIFRGNTILIILFILFDSDMIEGIIYYLKEKKESELVKRDCAVSENKVCRKLLFLELFWILFWTHIFRENTKIIILYIYSILTCYKTPYLPILKTL